MVCLNLKDKENKALLKKYADLVGSEDAAYYLLAMNNGFPLDATPQGDTSDLYLTLLQQAGGNEKQAVLKKALAYMPQFIEANGDWTTDGLTTGTLDRNGEPSASMIVGSCDSSSIQELLGNDSNVSKVLADFEKQNIPWRQQAIDSAIHDARQDFINSYIAEVLTAEHNYSALEIYGMKIDARKTWDENKVRECMSAAQKHLAKVFKLKRVDLSDGTYYYKYDGTDKNQQLRVHFVNSLSEHDWTDENGVKHPGAFVEQGQANALCSIIYISMQDGDATTIIHELAHRYIRMFWDSEVVQEALLAVDQRWKKFGKKSDSRTVEEALVDHIVQSVDGKWTLSDKLKDTFKSFWHKFNNMIQEVIGKPLNENRNDSQNMLDLISTYFSLNEDLSNTKQEMLYYEKYSGTVFQSDINLKDAFYKIEETLEAKLASEKARPVPDNQEIYNIQIQLQNLRKKDANQEADVISVIGDFVNRASQDMNIAISKLNGILSGGQTAIESLDVADFMHIKTDIIGYYGNVMRQYVRPLLYSNKNEINQYNNNLPQLLRYLDGAIETASGAFNSILEEYTRHVIDIYSDYLVDVGDKERFKANAMLWAKNQINNGEANPMEQFFGPAVSASSPIIRLVEYITTEANRDVFQRALVKGNSLVDAYKSALNAQENSLGTKLSPKNFMRQFCELDDEGLPTGYFVNEYNKGQFNKNRDKKLAQLVDRHNVKIDPESQEFVFDTKQQYINFYTDYYKWLDGEANMRYTVDYYINRLQFLSKPTITVVQRLDEQIHTLLDKCTDPNIGVPIVADLSRLEQLQLKQLQQERQDLSNPYIITKDDQGNITSVVEKSGDALDIANELSAWYYFQSQFIKTKQNRQKFNQAEQYIINKYGQNSPQHIDFNNQYQYKAVNPELQDLVPHKDLPEEVRELQNRKRKIMSAVNKKGFYTPHLELLNKDAWKELQRIDQEIADFWRSYGKPSYVAGPEKWQDVFESADVMAYAGGQLTNETYLRTLYNKALIQSQTDPSAITRFYDDYYYTDEKGHRVPLSVFKYIRPVGGVQNKYGITPIVDMLNSPFTDIDLNSAWVNRNFVQGGESLQLKDKYKNPQYDKLVNGTSKADRELGKVYKLLIDTMEEAYKMMPNLNPNNKYRLPQMRDRDAHMLFRHGIGNGIVAATFGFDTFNFTERDTRYNEEMTTRPDGTIVETVPQRWVQPLDDPSMTCTDVIGTVAMFYEMACNFQNKSKLAPMFQALQLQLEGGVEGNKSGNFMHQAYRLKKFIQMYVYGRTRTGFKGGKMNQTERRLAAITDKLASKAHSMLMSHNWRAVLKNAYDSASTLTQEILAGKYFTVQDALWGNKIVGGEIFKAIASVGKTKAKSKLVALMQYNGATNSISEIFSRHNETWLRRVFGRFFHMGEYTLVDFTFKGWITAMTYHAIRLVVDPNTGEQKFMTKDQAMYAYHKAGQSMKEGKRAWKKAKTTLYDAYEIGPDGNIKIVDQYRDKVRPKVSTNVGYENEQGERESRKIETRVHGIIRERSAVVNGILDSTSGSAFSQNYLGALVLQMRGWFLTQNFDNLKAGHDFAEYSKAMDQAQPSNEYARESQPSKYKQAIRYYKSKPKKSGVYLTSEDEEFEGQYNFETGTIERGQWRMLSALGTLPVIRNLLNCWKHLKCKMRGVEYDYNTHGIKGRKFTTNEVYALRRLSVAVGMLALTSLMTIFTSMLVTKYPKEWASEFLYAINVAAISERSAQIPFLSPLTALDIVNSVAISKSFIDNLGYSIDFFGDMINVFKQDVLGLDSQEAPPYEQPVQSGSYKGKSVMFRDFMKTMGVIKPEWGMDNIVRNTEPYGNISSSNYYINKVAPTSTLSAKPDRKTNSSSSSSSNKKSSKKTGSSMY